MYLLIAVPSWVYYDDRELVSIATNRCLLPFITEASAESSDSKEGLEQARRNYAAMLDLYIKSLDSNWMSYCDIGRSAQLRSQLHVIKKDLESEEAKQDSAKAIRKATNDVKTLYDKFRPLELAIPMSSRGEDDGCVGVAINAFCTTADAFESVVNRKLGSADSVNAVPDKDLEGICELACLDSRLAHLVLVCKWHLLNQNDRRVYADHFEHCLVKTLEHTQRLAKLYTASRLEMKADTFNRYAISMRRRLNTIDAMKKNDFEKATSKMMESIGAITPP